MEKKAKYGEKMIQVKMYFFTDGIAESKDKIVPKHAWTKGQLSLIANESHEIRSRRTHFNTLMELTHALQELLIEGGITLHVCDDMKRLIHREK